MTDLLPQTFRTLARYNRLANQRLYDGAARLSDAARKADRAAFFGSIHNTLNHILHADRIWMGRFEQKPIPYTRLDAVLHDDFGGLRTARQAEDARIEAFFATAPADFFGGQVRWTTLSGQTNENPVAVLALHLFNHQTHHRGQTHDLLCQAGVRDVVLDLPPVLNSAP